MMESGNEPCPLHGRFKIKIVENMDKYSDEVLMTKVEELKDIDDFDSECESCKRLILMHSGIQACTRSEKADGNEYAMIWREFRSRMKN